MTAATAPSTRVWDDRKRTLYVQALIAPSMPFAAGALVWLSGWNLFWWLGPILFYILMPILDAKLGLDTENPPEALAKQIDEDRWYRYLTYAYIPVQFAGLFWAARLWSQGDLSTLSAVGLAITVGTVAGVGINTAHELGHKRPTLEQWLSKVALAQSFYGHFFIEHNRGHHQNVSTPEDPASSRMGESLWSFLPRTVVGSVRSALHLERERSARAERSFWSVRNDVLNAWAMSVVLVAALVAIFGTSVLPYVLIQGVFGFFLLEVVNYIEHYGLLRAKKDNGRYERCMPEHSWNASNAASNIVLFQLQRHSDHHAYPTRRYQTLRHFDDVPQLPTGYAGMIVLATVPPLWRKVMDPRVLAHYDGDLAKVNVQPTKRAKLEARYAGWTPGTATAA